MFNLHHQILNKVNLYSNKKRTKFIQSNQNKYKNFIRL
jgi:hypothetical protein